jgi:hypothetical protein
VAILSTILSITFGVLFAIDHKAITNINNMCETQLTRSSIGMDESSNKIIAKAYELALTVTNNICQFTYPNSSNRNNN